MEDVIKLIVNNGVAVAVIVYFMWAQSTFMKELNESIKTLSKCVESLKTMIETLHTKDEGEHI